MIGLVAASMIGAATLQSEAEASMDASVTVFEAACLDIRGDREALRALAQTLGWEAGQPELHPLMDWMDVYVAGTVEVKLAHVPYKREGEGFRPEQMICSVDKIMSDERWVEILSAQEVEGSELGAPDPIPDTYQLPAGVELALWTLRDGSRLHGSYIPERRELEISVNYPARYGPR